MENVTVSASNVANPVRVTEWIDPKKLIPHPANSKFYSDINETKDLQVSIKAAKGIIHPIIVNKDYQILSGNRRTRAAIELGFEVVLIEIASDVEDEVVFIINANVARKKTYRTIVAEALMLKKHAYKLKKQKQIYELRKLYPEASTQKKGWDTTLFVARVMKIGLTSLKSLFYINKIDDTLLDKMEENSWSIDKTFKLAKKVYTGESTELPTHRKAKYYCEACKHTYTVNVAIEDYKEDSTEEILTPKVKRTDTDPEKNPVNLDEYFNTEENKKSADVINSLYDNAPEAIVPEVVNPADEDTDPFKDLGYVNDGQIKIPFLLPPYNRPIINVNGPVTNVAADVTIDATITAIVEETPSPITEPEPTPDVTTTKVDEAPPTVIEPEPTPDNTTIVIADEATSPITESKPVPDATTANDDATQIINDNRQATDITITDTTTTATTEPDTEEITNQLT